MGSHLWSLIFYLGSSCVSRRTGDGRGVTFSILGLQKVLRWIGRHRLLTLALVLALAAVSASLNTWSLYHQVTTIQAARLREGRLTRYLSEVSG